MLTLLLLTGCAGELNSSSGLVAATVSFSITVPPPPAAQPKSIRLILSKAQLDHSDFIYIQNIDATVGGTFLIPPDGSQLGPLLTGPTTLTTQLFFGPNATGAIIDIAGVPVTLQPGPNRFGFASDVPVDSLLLVANQAIILDQVRSLQIVARDKDGNFVLLPPSNVTYTVVSGTDIVQAVNNNTQLKGVKLGTATVTVTINGKSSAPVTVSVIRGVFITPTDVSVAPLGQQVFTANVPVVWTLQEGALAGSLITNSDGSATYTASNTIGTFHILAVNQATPSQSATTTVTVQSGSGDFHVQ